jgi:hypothetical protein
VIKRALEVLGVGITYAIILGGITLLLVRFVQNIVPALRGFGVYILLLIGLLLFIRFFVANRESVRRNYLQMVGR